MLASTVVAVASAFTYQCTFSDSDISYTNNDTVWAIPIKSQLTKEQSYYEFDGQDIIVDSIHYYVKINYWDTALTPPGVSTKFVEIPISPSKVSVADSQLKIWWNTDELQATKTDGSIYEGDYGEGTPDGVTIDWTITNGKIVGYLDGYVNDFLATGPGFTYAFRPR